MFNKLICYKCKCDEKEVVPVPHGKQITFECGFVLKYDSISKIMKSETKCSKSWKDINLEKKMRAYELERRLKAKRFGLGCNYN